MRVYGRARVHDLLGDFIVYRSLAPLDPRLPGLPRLRDGIGLAPGLIPRKSTPEYAQVVVSILREAQKLNGNRGPVMRLVYIGDTRVNDGIAFSNLCQAGGWRGMAFIGAEDGGPARLEVVEEETGTLVFSNHWAGLEDFPRVSRDFPIDEQTVVVIDLDKTLLGARGRNDHVIDKVRLTAVRETIFQVLGEDFSEASFTRNYTQLNQPEFHPFTTDNQDYLAYVCLILESGLLSLEELTTAIRSGRMRDFTGFLSWVDARVETLPRGVRRVHEHVRTAVMDGDPTPFKEFRRNEYRETVSHMGYMDDESLVQDLLTDEIVITHEVKQAAIRWRDQGALLFGLSDKPDEASLPPSQLEAQGYQPIHRVSTHVVGG